MPIRIEARLNDALRQIQQQIIELALCQERQQCMQKLERLGLLIGCRVISTQHKIACNVARDSMQSQAVARDALHLDLF